METGIQAITFNAAALHKNTKIQLNLESQSTNQIENYVVNGEFLSKLQPMIGLHLDENINKISNSASEKKNMFAKHKIRTVIDILK